MNNPLLLLSLFFYTSFAHAEGITSLFSTTGYKNNDFTFAISLYGKGIEENSQSGRIAGSRLEGSLTHTFNPSLSVKLRAELKIETGFAQTTFSDEFTPKQTPRLVDAHLNWAPASFFATKVGALDQGHVDSPLLFLDQTFPGALEIFQLPLGPLAIKLEAEQAIPTSVSTNVNAKPATHTPFFFWSRLSLTHSQKENPWVGNLGIGYFNFQNLNDGVASKGRVWGNSVEGLGAQQATFIYAFEGVEYGGEIKWLGDTLQPSLRLGWLANMRAPLAASQGFYVKFKTDILLDSDFSLSPRIELFRLESDAAPAFYTNKDFGHTNRRGYAMGFDFNLKKENILLAINWIASEPITNTAYQSSFRELAVSMRANL